MQFFVQHAGIQQGPHSCDTVRTLLANGSLSPTDLARSEDSEEWISLANIQGFEGADLRTHRKSTLAVWSLVLAILGIFTLGITSIPAVVCGHLASGKIRKSAGALVGQGMATAGTFMGYLFLVVFAILIPAFFVAGSAAVRSAKNVSAMATASAIESAIKNYYQEYGEFPSKSAALDTSGDVSLVKALRGKDGEMNGRDIQFLTVKEHENGRHGLNPDTFQLLDSWGRGYQVLLATDYADDLVVIRGSFTEKLKARQVAVYSSGEDGIAGTADDVTSW